MVKVRLHLPIARMSGKMGSLTYRWMYSKQTLMKTPDSQAMADPEIRAHYEKVGKKAGRQPFRAAASDFFAGKNLLKVQ